MRFGLNTFLVSAGFTDADIPLIQTFKSYGADVIELAIVDPTAVSAPALVDALSAANMQSIVCGAFGPGRDLRGTEAEQLASVQYISKLIELAALLGSKVVCGPMYSETGRVAAHTPEERAQQMALIASHLKPLCEQAEAVGVTLAVEPLNRFETDCINTLDQMVDLIESVGSPALKIHMDTFHMNIEEEDSAAAILKHGKHIGHVHASASHRGLLGKDQVDWPGVFSALHAVGYEGDIVIESFSEGNEVIARAAAIWRPLYDSPEQLSVEGLKFLEDHWKLVEETEGLTV